MLERLPRGVRVLCEPGRSLVANAGLSLYTVGTVKDVPAGAATSRSTAAWPTTFARCSTTPSTKRRSPTGSATRPPAALVGMHCESGDVLIEEARLEEPAGRRRRRRPGDRRLRPLDGEQLQRRPAAAGRLLPRRRGAGRGQARDLRGPHRARCLSRLETRPHRAARPRHGRRRLRRAASPSAPPRSRPHCGRRPEISGVLTRGEGDFDEVLAGSDLIVELIGGTEPAREHVLAALRGGQAGGHRQQAAARPARRRALRRRPRGRGADPLRGRRRRRDPDRARDPGELRRDRDLEGLRDRQRDDQLHPQRDGGDRRRLRGGAGAGQAARLRRGGPDRGRQRRRRRGEDGDPRPARLPHADHARRRRLRGHRDDPARRPRLREGAGPLAEAARRRRTPRRRAQRPRLPLLPLRRPPAGPGRRPLQRGHGRGARDHRGDDVRARAPAARRPPRRCSATWSRSSPATLPSASRGRS